MRAQKQERGENVIIGKPARLQPGLDGRDLRAVGACFVESNSHGDVEDAIFEHLAVPESVLALVAGWRARPLEAIDDLVGRQCDPFLPAESFDQSGSSSWSVNLVDGQPVEAQAAEFALDRRQLVAGPVGMSRRDWRCQAGQRGPLDRKTTGNGLPFQKLGNGCVAGRTL